MWTLFFFAFAGLVLLIWAVTAFNQMLREERERQYWESFCKSANRKPTRIRTGEFKA